ncbi:Rne/Rng family ribonuclease, partial [Bacteroidota bacterium]
MINELVIDVSSSEIVIVLLQDKQLVEIHKEKSNLRFAVGDIYLGKVRKIMPALNAAFINVGYGKDAFLHYLDLGPQFRSLNRYLHIALTKKAKLPPFEKFNKEPDIEKTGKIKDLLSSKQNIFVQITKEPISTKGPRLTSEISIAGRNLVLLPFSDKVSISQKIHTEEEKSRLIQLIQSIIPNNYGAIIRTAAQDKKVATLDVELKNLISKWEDSFNNIDNTDQPKLIISELNRTSAILRDLLNASFNNIYVNDLSLAREIKEYIGTIVPEKQKIVKHYSGSAAIFDHFNINKQISGHFGKTVSIKNGVYLVIEHTEALHVIDVNSGNRTKTSEDQETNALEVNKEAAIEIARQLRLRDMGGIIVVDFIDMHSADNRQAIFDKMKEAMEGDRTKHKILPLSKFGLMQITRQRFRPEMNIETIEKCPTCDGKGKISPSILLTDKIESNIKYLIEKTNNKSITLHVHPYIEAYLTKGLLSQRKRWLLKYRKNIRIKMVSTYS